MALQDLTPQLRTRLSRMERVVGWFVMLAIILLGVGFVYYAYNTAERKGWFLTKAPYYLYVKSSTGLKVGDPVTLMGFDAGAIIEVKPMPADQYSYNVFIKFELKSPNYGYIWTVGSLAKITAADLLGKRVLEVTRGTAGYATYISYPLQEINPANAKNLPDPDHWMLGEEIYGPSGTNLVAKPKDPILEALPAILQAGYTNVVVYNTAQELKALTGIWDPSSGRYVPYQPKSSGYHLSADESPAVTEQLQAMVGQVQQALPNVLNLTNVIGTVLSNTATLTSNLNLVSLQARPMVSNLTAATAHLDQPGALGEWLLPTNLNRQLEGTLANANLTLSGAHSNLDMVAGSLNETLENLGGITSNLNQQVQANPNLVRSISDAIVHADEFVQGLKRFWLFRHLFPNKPAAPKSPPMRPAPRPPAAPGVAPTVPTQAVSPPAEAPSQRPPPLLSPKAAGQ